MKLSKSLLSTTTTKIKGAAKSLFAAKGFDSVTVKEIGQKSRSNPALINYHFGGKKELYYAILEEFTADGRESARSLLTEPSTPAEFIDHLNLYLRLFLERYLKDPELHLLLHRECEKARNKSQRQRFEDQILDVFVTLEQFYATAKNKGLIKESVDPRLVTLMLFCTLGMLCQRDDLHKKFIGISLQDSEDLESVSRHLLLLYGYNLLTIDILASR